MRQALYTCSAVQRLINEYTAHGGEIYEIEPGGVGYGFMILTGDGLKTAIIKEVYLNEWNSGHTIRMYNKIPAKYAAIIAAL